MRLADHDVYQSLPLSRKTLLARLSPWPELPFYLSVGYTVALAGHRASRGRYSDDQWVVSSLRIVRALEGVGARLVVEGMDHVRGLDGPAVFVGNHMSTLETFVLPCIIQPVRPVTFVVKSGLLTYPVFGHVMRSRDPVVVGRQNPREDLAAVLRDGKARLDRGVSVIVFPQTTRSVTLDPARFNSIGAKLAARAGVPVVPIALQTHAWGNGKRLKDVGRVDPSIPVRFRFGPPLAPDGRGNAVHRACLAFVQETLGEWGVPVVQAERARSAQ